MFLPEALHWGREYSEIKLTEKKLQLKPEVTTLHGAKRCRFSKECFESFKLMTV